MTSMVKKNTSLFFCLKLIKQFNQPAQIKRSTYQIRTPFISNKPENHRDDTFSSDGTPRKPALNLHVARVRSITYHSSMMSEERENISFKLSNVMFPPSASPSGDGIGSVYSPDASRCLEAGVPPHSQLFCQTDGNAYN